eukprot:3774900-Rhodomonas_salina.1
MAAQAGAHAIEKQSLELELHRKTTEVSISAQSLALLPLASTVWMIMMTAMILALARAMVHSMFHGLPLTMTRASFADGGDRRHLCQRPAREYNAQNLEPEQLQVCSFESICARNQKNLTRAGAQMWRCTSEWSGGRWSWRKRGPKRSDGPTPSPRSRPSSSTCRTQWRCVMPADASGCCRAAVGVGGMNDLFVEFGGSVGWAT